MEYAELYARSAYSLLDAACLPERLVEEASALGLYALSLADRDDVGGSIRFSVAAEALGFRAIQGATLTMEEGGCLPLLVLNQAGWSNLCRLISLARMTHERGFPRTSLATLAEHAEGLFALTGPFEGVLSELLMRDHTQRARTMLGQLGDIFGEHLAIQVCRHRVSWEDRMTARLLALSKREGIPWVPTNDVRYVKASDRRVLDVMTSLKHRVTLEGAGKRLLPNDEWHLKGPRQMAALWRDHPESLRRTLGIADRVSFSLSDLRPTLPSFGGGDDDRLLRQKVWSGATRRYGAVLSETQECQLAHELRVIVRLDLAGYFLIVADIVDFAVEREILVQGRGSAANSAVCYCLGITAIDPIGMDLLFERFLSEERSDPPDIDLDIAHQRREEVLQYVYKRFGPRHAAMVCTTITWRGKSAIRDVARVMGLQDEDGSKLARQVGHAEAGEAAQILKDGGAEEAGFDPRSRRIGMLIDVVRRMDRLPRHRSIHTGGFVLSAEPLDTFVAIEPASMLNRSVIQWDKDDLGPAGLIKIDLLGLGILTLIDQAIRFIKAGRGITVDLAHLPMDDPAVYDMLARADTVGLFQVESRAQMNTLPRLKPRTFYDLVVQIALIRPGPIQGKMVHPYIRRRRGEEPVTYLHPDLEPVLKRTLGIPLFQEQGMKVAITMAGFTPGQADRLRKSMGFKRATDHLEGITRDLWTGMLERGVKKEVALQILHQLEGFANYGFPESHSASFALLTYASAWLKAHFQPEFTAAILNAQPMGFYSPATLIADAQRHGLTVRPVDLLFSQWDSTLEYDVHPPALRLGLRLIRGLSTAAREMLQDAAARGFLTTFEDLVFKSQLPDPTLITLAKAGAFRSMWPGRREALWELLGRLKERGHSLPLHNRPEGVFQLPAMSLIDEVGADYALLGLSHQHHPMHFLRQEMNQRNVTVSKELKNTPPNRRVRVAGTVICRQRPPAARGVFFMTLEDEFGMINVAVMPQVFEKNRACLSRSATLLVTGKLERHQGAISIQGWQFEELSGARMSPRSRDFH